MCKQKWEINQTRQNYIYLFLSGAPEVQFDYKEIFIQFFKNILKDICCHVKLIAIIQNNVIFSVDSFKRFFGEINLPCVLDF